MAIRSLEAELRVIQNSLGWRLVEGFRRRVNRLFPESSKRRQLYLKSVSAGKIYLNQGFFTLLREAMRKLRARGGHSAAYNRLGAEGVKSGQGSGAQGSQQISPVCPVQSKCVLEQTLDNEADAQAIGNKIRLIKNQLLQDLKEKN